MITWLILELVAAGFCSLAIWSRYPTRARLLSVLAFLATMPATGAILVANGGWSVKPIPYLSELPDDGVITGISLVQDVAIYLMIDVDGAPRLFQLPWSNQKASQLQRMMEAGNGGTLKAKRGKTSDDYPATFHEAPQPPASDKAAEAAPPVFNQGF